MISSSPQHGSALWSWRRDEKIRQRIRKQLRGSIDHNPATAEYAIAALPDHDISHLINGSVRHVRRVVNAAQRQITQPVSDGNNVVKLTTIPRPAKQLREKHCPSLFPGLVNSKPPPRSYEPMAGILGTLEGILHSGQHRYSALDWLHSVSGLDWPLCGKILHAIGFTVDEGAIKMIANARKFWVTLNEFRRIHSNAVHLKQIEPADGDWAFVTSSELPGWLPGLHVPKMDRLATYLIRIVPQTPPFIELDFHSVSYRPLFRVPM